MRLYLLLLLALLTSCTTTTSSGLRLPTADVVLQAADGSVIGCATLMDGHEFAARGEATGFARLVDSSGFEFARIDLVAGRLVVADLRKGDKETLEPGDPVPEWAQGVVARLEALQAAGPPPVH